MLSAAGFEKNKLFYYLLEYIAKRDAEFTATLPSPIPKDIKNPVWNPENTSWEEATEENMKDVPKLNISLEDIRKDIGGAQGEIYVQQVEHCLLFIFLRKKKDVLSKIVQDKLISDWNNVCDFAHTHTTIVKDIQFYVEDEELANTLYQEYEDMYKSISIEDLHEICLYDSTKNMDGTYCYYVSQIGVMGNHIITTNMIKELTKESAILKYISDDTSKKDIKIFIEKAKLFVDKGLDEKYENIFEMLIEMLTNLKSWLKDPTFIFYDYATRVPANIRVIQPKVALEAYKKIFEESNK